MDAGSQTWAAVAAAFVAGALALVTLAMLVDALVTRRRNRVVRERIAPGPTREEAPGSTREEIFLASDADEAGALDRILGRMPRSPDLRRLLEQAGVGWSPLRFYLLTLGTALAAGLTTYLFVGIAIVAVVPAILAATAPYLYVQRRKRKRVEAFEQAFPEAIDLLGRAIRAGHAFSTGLQMVADEMPEALAHEFRRIFEEQKFGLPLEDALLSLVDRVDSLDVRIFTTAVLIQREVGGNLAEILDNLAGTIRERFTIQRQVRVYTAQGRFTGYLLAALPIAVGFLITLLNRDYMSILWTEPVGRMLIATAVMLQVVGYFIIRRIVDIEI